MIKLCGLCDSSVNSVIKSSKLILSRGLKLSSRMRQLKNGVQVMRFVQQEKLSPVKDGHFAEFGMNTGAIKLIGGQLGD